MKRFILSIIIFLAGVVSFAQIKNFPLPQNPDTLKILAIGNSFSDDGMQWLPELLESAGIHNVVLGRLYIGGCSLERHCKEFEGNLHNYIYYKSTDNRWISKKNVSLAEGVKDEDWDIISMQQRSGMSGIYDTYTPWLENLIKIVRSIASNPTASIVWHQTWAYSRNSDHSDFVNYDKNQQKMYNAINDCVQRLKKDANIEIVIPSGTTIQMLRNSKLNDSKDLTRDGYHLNLQYGRYAAACAWFEALIKPTLGVSVKKAHATLKGTGHELAPANARLCRKVAVKAVKSINNR